MVEIGEEVVRTTQLLNDGENSIRWSRDVEDTGHRGSGVARGRTDVTKGLENTQQSILYIRQTTESVTQVT